MELFRSSGDDYSFSKVLACVGRPLFVEAGKFICHAQVSGLQPNRLPIYGVDTLQALTCGINYLALKIDDQIAAGEKFVITKDELRGSVDRYSALCLTALSTQAAEPDVTLGEFDESIESLDNRVAELELVTKTTNGHLNQLLLSIGRPYTIGEHWFCCITLHDEQNQKVIKGNGQTSLHSLCSGLRSLCSELKRIDQEGNSLWYPISPDRKPHKFFTSHYFFPIPVRWFQTLPEETNTDSVSKSYAYAMWAAFRGLPEENE